MELPPASPPASSPASSSPLLAMDGTHPAETGYGDSHDVSSPTHNLKRKATGMEYTSDPQDPTAQKLVKRHLSRENSGTLDEDSITEIDATLNSPSIGTSVRPKSHGPTELIQKHAFSNPVITTKYTPQYHPTSLEALFTIRAHTTNQLNIDGDEYIPRRIDEQGDKKVTETGHPLHGREYRCRTFLIPGRGDKLFMLATECAGVLGYRKYDLLFNKNGCLYKIIPTEAEKDDLIRQEIIPYYYRSRQSVVVTARSMFRQFGSRLIMNGRRVRDDYWEGKARELGFTEEDTADARRPSTAAARAVAVNPAFAPLPEPYVAAHANYQIQYGIDPLTTHVRPFPPPRLFVQHVYGKGKSRILLQQPNSRLDSTSASSQNAQPIFISRCSTQRSQPDKITGRWQKRSFTQAPLGELGRATTDDTCGEDCPDQCHRRSSANMFNSSPSGETLSQATQTAELNKKLKQQCQRRKVYLDAIWSRPHEPPVSISSGASTSQISAEPVVPRTQSPSSCYEFLHHYDSPHDLDGSRTVTKHTPVMNAAPSDSDYRSGYGTGTVFVYLYDSTGSSLGFPHDLLQNFVAIIGDSLIKEAGAWRWAEHALAHHPTEAIETVLNAHLRTYALELASNTYQPHQLTTQVLSRQPQLRLIATRFIYPCRPLIARDFRGNALSVVEIHGYDDTRGMKTITITVGNHSGPTGQTDKWARTITDCAKTITDCADVTDWADDTNDWAESINYDWADNTETWAESIDYWVDSNDPETTFRVKCDIEAFMHAQYGDDLPLLASVVVLTGSAYYAQATTCEQYIRSVWPKTGGEFFVLLQTALIAGSASTDKSPLSRSIAVEIENQSKCILVRARKLSQTALQDLAQQLGWITCVFRMSPFGERLAYAKPSLTLSLNAQSAHENALEISHEEHELHTSEDACWTPLFSGAVIASEFPIPERMDEIGLELSLELLAELGGVRHAVEYEGGVVLKGFSHMFIPIRKVDDRIQWHAISSQDSETRLTYHDAVSRCASRAFIEEVGFDDIQQCRHFLGWCTTATSRLGSTLADYENIDYSIAEETGRSFLWTGVSAGVQQIGVGAGSFKLGTNNGPCHFRRSGPFRKIVSYAEKTPILLYDTGGRKTGKHKNGSSDTGGQRAWLVPASAVLLHMIQHMHHLEPFEVNGTRVEVDMTIPVGYSARDILLRNENLQISDDDDYSFKYVIVDLWSKLEFLIDQNLAREQNMEGTPLQLQSEDIIRGYEFRAVVEGISPFVLKMAKLRYSHGGWPQLITDINALVLFANGFGDLILPRPEEKAKMCSKWHTLMTGLDHLATSTYMLTQLYIRAGSRLDHQYLTSTGLRWHQENQLFGNCRNLHTCQCDRLQHIISKHSCGSVTVPGTLLDSGAVMFGRSRWGNLLSSSYNRSPKIEGMYSQPNAAMVPITLREYQEDGMMSGSCQSQLPTAVASSIESSSTCTTLATEYTTSETQQELSITSRENFMRKRPCSLPVSGEDMTDRHEECAEKPSNTIDNVTISAAEGPRKRNKVSDSDHIRSECEPSVTPKEIMLSTSNGKGNDLPLPDRTSKIVSLTDQPHFESNDSHYVNSKSCSNVAFQTTHTIETESRRSLRRVGALNKG